MVNLVPLACLIIPSSKYIFGQLFEIVCQVKREFALLKLFTRSECSLTEYLKKAAPLTNGHEHGPQFVHAITQACSSASKTNLALVL